MPRIATLFRLGLSFALILSQLELGWDEFCRSEKVFDNGFFNDFY